MSDTNDTAPVIYRILSMANDEQLNPLVETLSGTPLSFLRLCRAFERHAPAHRLYIDQIGDELYRLGQKALGIVDGTRPSYGRMLTALCKQLGVPGAEDDLADMETTLLNLFTPQRLVSINPSERQHAVSEAGRAASKGASKFFGAEEWGPLAACLLQVAYVRSMLIEAQRAELQEQDFEIDGSASLVIGSDEGSPVIALTRIDEASGGGWRKVASDDTAIGWVSPYLQLVPAGATGAALKAGRYMKVTVAAGQKLVHSPKHDSLIGTVRQQGSHRFAGAAKLAPGALGKVISAGSLVTFASAALAQKHLADISQKLSEIEADIEQVSGFQKEERKSVLTGSVHYFEQIAPAVLSGDRSDEVVNVIEMHEAQLLRVQDHLAADLRSQTEALRAIRDEAWVGQTKYVRSIEEHQATLGKLHEEMLLCLRARACGWQLLSAFPGRERRKESRLEDIKSSLRAMSPDGETAIMLDRVLREKINKVGNVAERSRMLREENAFLNRHSVQSLGVMKGMHSVSEEMNEETSLLTMEFMIEDDVIVATRVVQPTPRAQMLQDA